MNNDAEVLSLLQLYISQDISDTVERMIFGNNYNTQDYSKEIENMGLYENLLKSVWKNPNILNDIKEISDNLPNESQIGKSLTLLVNIFNEACKKSEFMYGK